MKINLLSYTAFYFLNGYVRTWTVNRSAGDTNFDLSVSHQQPFTPLIDFIEASEVRSE